MMNKSDFQLVSGRYKPRMAPRPPHRPVIISRGSVGVLILLKCASRSMFASSADRMTIGEGTPPRKVHVFIREPIQRLRSVYQFFNGVPPIIDSEQTSFTWEEFVDLVLAGAKNPHWRPASEVIEEAGVNVRVHLFENIGSEYPLGELERKNVSSTIEVDMDYRKDELQEFYQDDYELRSMAGFKARTM